MKRKQYITKSKKYVHLSEATRYKIEALLEGGVNVNKVSEIVGRDRSTIYREIKRGSINRLQSDLSEKRQYRANVGQFDYEEKGKNKERGLKIGKDRKLEEYIREKLKEDRFSPDVIIGQIKDKGLKFESLICTKTLYNYIDANIFSEISNDDLWEKGNKKKRKYKKRRRASVKNRLARSIEDRPKEVNDREEYGHWEGDTVKGAQGLTTGLFTMTERKTREEIIVKISQSTQDIVVDAIDELEKRYDVDFKEKFKSITFDNGSEFLDWESIERSVLVEGEKRTMTYFAHPYSSWERGTNENANRIIRRFIPKGTDISCIDDEDIQEIQDWMNNYPRKILGYKTPNEMAKECLQNNKDQKFNFVAL